MDSCDPEIPISIPFFCDPRQRGDDRLRARQRAEDAVLDRHHMQRGFVRPAVAAGAGVRNRQALEIAVAGLAQRRVNADIGRAAGEHQMGDAARPQHQFQIRIGEGAVTGLVDNDVLGPDFYVGDDLEAWLERSRISVPSSPARLRRHFS